MTVIIENGDFPDGTVPPAGQEITDVLLVPGGATIIGGLTASDIGVIDIDAFEVTLAEGDLLTVQVSSNSEAAVPIVRYETGIFDRDLNLVAQALTQSDFEVLTTRFFVPDTGTPGTQRVFFSVTPAAADPVDDVVERGYRITTTVTADDHGGQLATATALASGQSASGLIAAAGDRDVFATTVATGQQLQITLQQTAFDGSAPEPFTGTLAFLAGAGVVLGATQQINATTFAVDVLQGGQVGTRVGGSEALFFQVDAALSNGVLIEGGGDAGTTDIIRGFFGNDTLVGGLSDDLLIGGRGRDALDGGAGTDTATYFNATGGVIANLISGTAAFSDATGDTFDNIENLTGSAFDDILVGDTGSNLLIGLGGDDRLEGRQGDDLLIGRAGDDTLLGAAGEDALYGGLGDDFLNSGSNAGTLSGGAGNDTLIAGSTADLLIGGTGDDRLEGRSGSDRVHGGLGDDIVLGGGGLDVLTGGGGEDTLDGGASNDTLLGNARADRLDGGIGNDQLFGGLGGDTFIFTSRSFGEDVIRDFTAGDLIDLSGVGGIFDLGDVAFSVTNTGTPRAFIEITGAMGQPDNTIEVFGSAAGTLSASDFIFEV